MEKMHRSITAFLLIMCLTVGLCSNGVIVLAQQQKTIHYVSLGDSMTNGFGMLSGYDEHKTNGYLEVASDAYPAQFSAWMAGYGGPISAGQTTYKGTKGTVKLTQLATSGMRAEDLHYILKYGQPGAYGGDDYTFGSVLQPNGRWNSAYAGGVEKVSANFRDAIASADVISMAVGNANFGVYLASIVDFEKALTGTDDGENEEITLENALANLEPEMADVIRQVYNLVLSYLAGIVPEKMAKTLGDQVGYVAINYLLHYSAALDEIVSLNPDAEIIIIGLFNTMNGSDAYVTYNGVEYYISLAELSAIGLSPINAYLSSIPARKQEQQAYKDITFYYAQADDIETLADTFSETFAQDKDFFRERFIQDVAEVTFPLIDPEQLVGIELADVKKYEATYQHGIAELAVHAQQQYDKAYSSAVYLALERAILKALQKTPRLSADEIMPYTSAPDGIATYFANVLSGAMDNYQQKTSIYAQTHLNDAAKAFVAAQKGIGMKEVTQANVEQAMKDVAQKQQITALAELYVATEALEMALTEDERISSLLCLYARMILSSGMSSHPNHVGHDTMTEAVIVAVQKGPLENTYSFTYKTTPSSYYLALGDATAYGASANALAKKLTAATVNPVGFTNKTVDNQTAVELLDVLPMLSGEIQKADLITLGFNGNQFMNFLVGQLKRVMANKELETMDWEEHLDDRGAAIVQMLLSKVQEKLAEGTGAGNVMGLDLKRVISVAIESYVYSYVVHLTTCSKVVKKIHAINPDAQILVIGMYNPLKGTVLNMEGEQLDVGEYLQYLINMVNMLYQTQAAKNGNFTYVKAPDVETGAKPATYDVAPFLMDLLLKGVSKYNPSVKGYAYIEEQIWNTLEVTVPGADQHKHEYCDWYVFKSATTKEEGLKRRDCIRCNHYEELEIPVKTGPSAITSAVYTIGASTVSKIAAGATVAQFLQGLGETDYVKVYKDGQEVSADKKLGTGMEIRLIVGGQTVQTLHVIITGDTNGDGAITVTDMLAVKSHVLNKTTLSSTSFAAGDTNGDGNITITDFIQIKAQILGKGNVVPR